MKSVNAMAGIMDSENHHVIVENVDIKPKLINMSQVLGEVSSIMEISSPVSEGMVHPVNDVKNKIDVDHLDPSHRDDVFRTVNSCAWVLSGDSDVGLVAVTAHEINLYDQTPIYQRRDDF